MGGFWISKNPRKKLNATRNYLQLSSDLIFQISIEFFEYVGLFTVEIGKNYMNPKRCTMSTFGIKGKKNYEDCCDLAIICYFRHFSVEIFQWNNITHISL